MTGLRRGFRAEAERLAIELRGELGLSPRDRVDPFALADLYGVPVHGTTDLEIDAAHVTHFAGRESGTWSALTVFCGTRRMIVLNDAHDVRRLANSLSHELAHLFLDHEPAPVLNPDGSRTWNRQVEAEANELGAQILIPDRIAKELAIRGLDPDDVAEGFGISSQLAEWRMRVSGGFIIRQRTRANR